MYRTPCSLLNRELPLAVFLLLIVPAMLLTSCGSPEKQDSAPTVEEEVDLENADVYTLEVVKDRKTKDLYFIRDDNSPIPIADREYFQRLNYYAPDKAFAFETTLDRLPEPESIIMATSKDKPRTMLHIGHLPFTYEGTEHRLAVYQPEDTTGGLYWFIPFTDATTGTETYSGGRYIDIERPYSDTIFLDFNYAYNPYCAYNDKYDCPIPPEENALPIAIKAGEKNYSTAH